MGYQKPSARGRRRKECIKMDKQAILNRVDHTLLTTTATWEQVKALCDQGLK